MTKKEFIKTISCFLQDPDAIVSDRGNIVFANGDAEYAVRLDMRDGDVVSVVDKDGSSYSPMSWIALRLAHIDRLASAILRQYGSDVDAMKYVPVSSAFNDASTGETFEVEDTERFLKERLQEREQCQTSVFFITSEAGDGKTILMRRMAVVSARAFLAGEQDWLYVPIELGGKPFLRLDEFILGSLSRTYRTPFFIEAFLAMVKCGRIVLALDGFEESAIQGADGEIISSLGTLLASLDSQGSVVFASRKAFYFHSHLHDYKSFATLAQSCDVSMAELNLKPWGSRQIAELSELYGLDHLRATELCNQLSRALGAKSPMLTRAVLAHKFVRELVCGEGLSEASNAIIARFQDKDEAALLHAFISYLLDRETGKLVKSDIDVSPILSSDEHEQILLTIADEMWRSDADALNIETLNAIVELAVEHLHLTPSELNRCRSHFPHHAMLKKTSSLAVGFCHIDFYQYFLGALVAHSIREWTDDGFDVRKILDRKPLPVLSLKECARRLIMADGGDELSRKIAGLALSPQGETPLGQNVTALRLMMHDGKSHPLEVIGMYCPEFVMRTHYLANVTLKECVVECCDLSLMAGANVRFVDCELSRACYIGSSSLTGLSFDGHSVPRILVRSADGEKADVGDVAVILTLLKRSGATIDRNENTVLAEEFDDDEKSAVFFKVVGLFDSRTYLTENVLKNRLGSRFSLFESEICPLMIKSGVLLEQDYHGRRGQRMFRLIARGDRLSRARDCAKGNFEQLIAYLNSEVK